jgi:hypothetical protein
MLELLYWMWYSEILDAWSYGGWGVFIALNHQGSRWGDYCRWSHRTGPVHYSVRCHVTQPLGFGVRSTVGALSPCGTGQSGAPLTFCSDFCRALFTYCSTLQSRPLRELAFDPLAHRTVRWIIAECAFDFPRVAGSSCTVLMHRTLSGGTPDSRCAILQHTQVLFAPFELGP